MEKQDEKFIQIELNREQAKFLQNLLNFRKAKSMAEEEIQQKIFNQITEELGGF